MLIAHLTGINYVESRHDEYVNILTEAMRKIVQSSVNIIAIVGPIFTNSVSASGITAWLKIIDMMRFNVIFIPGSKYDEIFSTFQKITYFDRPGVYSFMNMNWQYILQNESISASNDMGIISFDEIENTNIIHVTISTQPITLAPGIILSPAQSPTLIQKNIVENSAGHGFYIYDLENGVIKYEEIENKWGGYQTVKIDLSGNMDRRPLEAPIEWEFLYPHNMPSIMLEKYLKQYRARYKSEPICIASYLYNKDDNTEHLPALTELAIATAPIDDKKYKFRYEYVTVSDLILSNIGPFAGKNELSFHEGLNIFQCPIGKTTIIDALIYVLYGVLRRYTVDTLAHNMNTQPFILCTAKVGTNMLTVERFRNGDDSYCKYMRNGVIFTDSIANCNTQLRDMICPQNSDTTYNYAIDISMMHTTNVDLAHSLEKTFIYCMGYDLALFKTTGVKIVTKEASKYISPDCKCNLCTYINTPPAKDEDTSIAKSAILRKIQNGREEFCANVNQTIRDMIYSESLRVAIDEKWQIKINLLPYALANARDKFIVMLALRINLCKIYGRRQIFIDDSANIFTPENIYLRNVSILHNVDIILFTANAQISNSRDITRTDSVAAPPLDGAELINERDANTIIVAGMMQKKTLILNAINIARKYPTMPFNMGFKSLPITLPSKCGNFLAVPDRPTYFQCVCCNKILTNDIFTRHVKNKAHIAKYREYVKLKVYEE